MTDKERLDYFGRIPGRGSNEIRKGLGISDEGYHNIYGPSFYKPREYFIYGLLNELEKAGISLVETSSFIVGSREEGIKEETDPEQKRIARNIYQSKIDETTLWERKLTEQLIDLVGFRRASGPDYFRHYLILSELDKTEKIYKDFRDYHGAKNRNLQHQIDRLKQDADQALTKLDPRKCWYVDDVTKPTKKYKLAPLKKRFDRILPFMTDAQKVAVGRSYGAYSAQSQNLHPSQSKIHYREPSMDTLDQYYMRICILSGHVIIAVKDVLRLHNKKGFLKELGDMFKKNPYPSELLADLTNRSIEVGDFVLAYGDLAEVTKVIKSKHGYRSYAVRYLSRPPIPEIKTDEMPAQYVRRIYKRNEMALKVRELLQEGAPGLKPINTRRLNNSLRKTVVDFWNNGLREWTQGDRNGALEKMRLYGEKMRHSKDN